MENTHLVFYPEASEFSKNTYEFEKMGGMWADQAREIAYAGYILPANSPYKHLWQGRAEKNIIVLILNKKWLWNRLLKKMFVSVDVATENYPLILFM